MYIRAGYSSQFVCLKHHEGEYEVSIAFEQTHPGVFSKADIRVFKQDLDVTEDFSTDIIEGTFENFVKVVEYIRSVKNESK